MALKTLVKVGNISNLSDARYCAGMGVDMLGFTAIEGKENYINPALFQQIRGWVAGPKVVLELYGIGRQHDIKALLENYAPDYIELTLQEYQAFKDLFTVPFIVSINADELTTNNLNATNVAYWIIDDHSLSGIKPADGISVIVRLSSKTNVAVILEHAAAKGIALSGSQEIRPGFKDYEDLAEVLEMLEEE